MPRLRLGKKHCWSHCCLPGVKRSGPQIQNGSQHIPLHASISIPAPALLRLARGILWQAGECSSRRESTGRVWGNTGPVQLPVPGDPGRVDRDKATTLPRLPQQPQEAAVFNLGWLMGGIDPKSTSGQLGVPSREFSRASSSPSLAGCLPAPSIKTSSLPGGEG